jgi:prophage regulatory protein
MTTHRQSIMPSRTHNGAVRPAPMQPCNVPRAPGSGHVAGERLLRLPEVVRTLGVSRATIYRYVDSGRLPPPVKLSTRCIAWRASEITAWMAALQAG